MPRTMSNLYTRTRPMEVDAILAGLATVCGPTVWYLSTPVTTGTRYHQFLQQGLTRERDAETYTREVLNVNRFMAKRAASALWNTAGVPVICPSELDREGWTDGDYMSLWLAVIRARVGRVVANEGWYASSGCVVEVAEAFLQGIPVYDYTLLGYLGYEGMSPMRALDGIQEGRTAAAGLGLDTKWHDAAHSAIAEVILQRSERA